MSDFVEKLIKVANANEATKDIINQENAERLERLSSHMLEVNKSLNLTAIKDENGVILKHLVDSSACVPYIKENAKLCDIGCGGGFPSLVIAILRGVANGHITFTVVDGSNSDRPALADQGQLIACDDGAIRIHNAHIAVCAILHLKYDTLKHSAGHTNPPFRRAKRHK